MLGRTSEFVLFVLHYKEKAQKSDQNMNTPDYTAFYIIHNVLNRILLCNQEVRKSDQDMNTPSDYTPFYIIHRKLCRKVLYMWRNKVMTVLSIMKLLDKLVLHIIHLTC